MRLIVSSKKDEASKNIRSNLLDREWDEIGRYQDEPVYKRGNDILVTINERHIYFNNIDKKIEEIVSEKCNEVVFISKHSSDAGVDSLTVHPIGNYGEAKYGGKEGKLVPVSPHNMTEALHVLREVADEMGLTQKFDISFEATHHGPYLETKTYYIEIGSDDSSWKDKDAGETIARTVLQVGKDPIERPVAVCIGGGHYAPRFTDLAKSRDVSIGHIVPEWGMKYLTKESFSEMINKTPEVEYVYFDRSSTSGKERERVKNWAREFDLQIIRSSDLRNR